MHWFTDILLWQPLIKDFTKLTAFRTRFQVGYLAAVLDYWPAEVVFGFEKNTALLAEHIEDLSTQRQMRQFMRLRICVRAGTRSGQLD
jgi:hypothetical protein